MDCLKVWSQDCKRVLNDIVEKQARTRGIYRSKWPNTLQQSYNDAFWPQTIPATNCMFELVQLTKNIHLYAFVMWGKPIGTHAHINTKHLSECRSNDLSMQEAIQVCYKDLHFRHMEAKVCPTLITNLQDSKRAGNGWAHLIMKQCSYQRSVALQYY